MIAGLFSRSLKFPRRERSHDRAVTRRGRSSRPPTSRPHPPAAGIAGNGRTKARKPRGCWVLAVPSGAQRVPRFPRGGPVSAGALLAEVEAAGARLRVEGGRLVATGARLSLPLVDRLLASKA